MTKISKLSVMLSMVVLLLSTGAGFVWAEKLIVLDTWWLAGVERQKPLEDMKKTYMKKHPNVQVKTQYFSDWNDIREKSLTAMAAGKGPDLLHISVFDTPMYAKRNAVVNLDPYMEATPGWGRKDFHPEALKSQIYGGTVYSLPFGLNVVSLYMNEDLFNRVGLSTDEPPKTWDELIENAKILTKLEKREYGFEINYTSSPEGFNFLGPILFSYDVDLFDSMDVMEVTKAAFDNERAVEAVQMILDMIYKHKCVIPPGISIPNASMTNHVGQWINGPWQLAQINHFAPDLNFRCALLPATKYGPGISVVGGNQVAILATSKHQEVAWDYLVWCTNDDNNMAWNKVAGYLPGRLVLYDRDLFQKEPLSVFLKQVDFSEIRVPHPDIDHILYAICAQVEAAELGQQSAREAIEKAFEEVDEILAGSR